MGFDTVRRTPEEIQALGKECLEHETSRSSQFERLSYEQGVRATLRWLFFAVSSHPLEIEEPREILPEVVHSEVKLD